MNSLLPATGTNALLEQLSPFIPDTFLLENWPHTATGGRQAAFSAAQLWRVHLLVLLTPAHAVNLLVKMLPEQRAWRQFAHLPNRYRTPDARMLHEFRQRVGVGGFRRINNVILAPLLEGLNPALPTIGLMDATDLPAACRGFKKNPPGPIRRLTPLWGGRTLKTGQSRCFVGYKKHTLRLWLSAHREHVLLVPLVSWMAPANVGEGGLLAPSLALCIKGWDWRPDYVVADMGYLAAAGKQICRQRWQVTVLTHLRSNMKLVPPFEAESRAVCPQGQPLRWLGYDGTTQQQWFGTVDGEALCAYCWQQSDCPRQFVYHAQDHETLLGKLPLNTRAAQFLLKKVRPWIEPAQSYEKNQLGLGDLFLNSLRLAWCWGLLADAVCLLRARALRTLPPANHPLTELLPEQLTINWEDPR